MQFTTIFTIIICQYCENMELYIRGKMFQQDGALGYSTNTKFVK